MPPPHVRENLSLNIDRNACNRLVYQQQSGKAKLVANAMYISQGIIMHELCILV